MTTGTKHLVAFCCALGLAAPAMGREAAETDAPSRQGGLTDGPCPQVNEAMSFCTQDTAWTLGQGKDGTIVGLTEGFAVQFPVYRGILSRGDLRGAMMDAMGAELDDAFEMVMALDRQETLGCAAGHTVVLGVSNGEHQLAFYAGSEFQIGDMDLRILTYPKGVQTLDDLRDAHKTALAAARIEGVCE